ncbi:META domain-containing protein [Psychrobacter pacificensis]|uniref:META domain-containing protein n=1 Tax=Psychrobacter pacificensis TaxID=112002 RepID=UPI003D0660E2
MVGRAKKSALTTFLLPSIVAVSLMLSACQKENTAHDNEGSGISNTGEKVDSLAIEDRASDTNSATTESGSTTFTPEEKLMNTLSRHRWSLVRATDANEQPISELTDIDGQGTLVFNPETLIYSVGCNTISAAYQLQGHTLSIEEGMSTKMSCSDLDMAENTLNTLMLGNSELKIEQGDSPVLTQFTNDNVTLVWNGRLTPQAKYNSKGETVFWAVNAKEVNCDMNGEKQCLQVRPVTYNDQGVKVGEGEWRVFVGEIDGYQHDGMHEEVLRLQRYRLETNELIESDETTENDNDDEKYAYVLDAVIESAVVE